MLHGLEKKAAEDKSSGSDNRKSEPQNRERYRELEGV